MASVNAVLKINAINITLWVLQFFGFLIAVSVLFISISLPWVSHR
ncbi:hypothetical protein HMPREF9346_01343 [Escherichia coli MS 119-7]|nr:hypothetical protein HMPREF9346_01343 [Escherichia coli MS 119-7]